MWSDWTSAESKQQVRSLRAFVSDPSCRTTLPKNMSVASSQMCEWWGVVGSSSNMSDTGLRSACRRFVTWKPTDALREQWPVWNSVEEPSSVAEPNPQIQSNVCRYFIFKTLCNHAKPISSCFPAFNQLPPLNPFSVGRQWEVSGSGALQESGSPHRRILVSYISTNSHTSTDKKHFSALSTGNIKLI